MQDLTKLPLHEVLMANGFELDRTKSSRNYPMLVNRDKDLKLVVSKKGENYLYFNPNDDTDRGNLISYARIHQQDIKELVANYDSSIKTAKHYKQPFFDSAQISYKKIVNDYANFAPCDIKNNRLLEVRGFNKDYMNQFKDLLKQDEYGNIVIPNYKYYQEQNMTSMCGYTKRLALPINKDKQGNILEKPIKNIQYGSKGLEILSDKNTIKATKYIVISESTFDSIAYAQMKNLDIKETMLISTAGAINTENLEKALAYIIDTIQKERIKPHHNQQAGELTGGLIGLNVRIAFDNDEKGRMLTEAVKNFLSKEYKHSATTYQPFTKDCNDDLKLQNLTGIKLGSHQDMQNYKEWLNLKILDYQKTTIIKNPNTAKRKEILQIFRKADSLRPIPQNIKEEINKLSKIGHKAIKSL